MNVENRYRSCQARDGAVLRADQPDEHCQHDQGLIVYCLLLLLLLLL